MKRPLTLPFHRCAWALIACLILGVAGIVSAGEVGIGAEELSIVIRGEPFSGWPVLPASENEFRFKSRETNDILTFRWTDIAESDRKRVQRLYGLQIEDGRKVIGEKVTGVRYTLESGKVIEGLPIPDADTATSKAIRTINAPRILIPINQIRSEQPFEGTEGDFYKTSEIYEKWMLEKPPGIDDASAHLEMARKAAGVDLYDKALNHLSAAEIIDPRTKERNQEFREALITKHAKQQVDGLYAKLLDEKRTGDFVEAMDKVEQLNRNFPNSDMKTRWESLVPEIEAGLKVDRVKKVVQTSYRLAQDLIQKRMARKIRLDEQGNKVASIPGKQVTTRQSHIFRGTLVDSEAGGDLTLKVQDTTLRIRKKDVVSVQDVDLSTSLREVAPTYEELKEYVTDTGSPEGLKGEMMTFLSMRLKMPIAEVKKIFNTRLESEAVYEDGHLKRSTVYASTHDANYDKGSWLRDGAKPMPVVEGQATANTSSSYYDRSANRWRDRRTGEFTNSPDEMESPELTDDPEVWWKHQSSETRFAILKAFAAEKVFKVKGKIVEYKCSTCGGSRFVNVPTTGGNTMQQRCHTCRGIGLLVRFPYN